MSDQLGLVLIASLFGSFWSQMASFCCPEVYFPALAEMLSYSYSIDLYLLYQTSYHPVPADLKYSKILVLEEV